MISNILEDMSLCDLSYNQKKVWKNGAEWLYTQTILEFSDTIDKNHLLESIGLVINKHEVLSFVIVENKKESFPLQKPSKVYSITYYETEDNDEEKLINQLDKLYDFKTDTPLKFGLIIESGKVKRLFVRLYALWGDVYSNILFVSELNKAIKNKELYKNEEQQKVLYSKYCKWHKELISELDQDALNFWKSYGHEPSQNILPFLNNKKTAFKPKRNSICNIKGPLLERTKKYCDENKIELSEFLFSKFLDYLQKFTTNDITVGYYPLHRNYEELEQTLGLVNKVIPVKIASLKAVALNEKIQHMRGQIQAVELWSDYYLTNINDTSDNSDFFANFEFVSLKNNDEKEIQVIDLYAVQDVFELKLSCVEYDNHIAIDLYYDSERITSEDLLIIESQLQLIFGDLNNSSVLSKCEESIIKTSNNTDVNFDNYSSIVDLFEAQVTQCPESTALLQGNSIMTYSNLSEKSNQFANYLIKALNVKKGDAICLLLEPSVNFIISLFGVLKAGAYYIPIDHNYPKERIQYVLKDSQAKVLISDINSDEQNDFNIQILNPNDPIIFQSKNEIPKLEIAPSDLVYCIYTSGSTGNPKGCLINNRNLLNYIQWANGYYFKNKKEGNWGLITSVSFDLTVTSIFTSLTRGKKLWIGDANKDSSELLRECFENSDIDTLKLTPSHLSLLKEMDIKDTSVRTIICGGEQLKLSQVKILKTINSSIKVFNEYGPTETTVGCVVTAIDSLDNRVLIGKPIANTKIYIVDDQNKECGIGVTGEIVIVGEGLSIGYHNRKELTEEKFETNFINSGERGYKTGDLGRWLPDGNIECLGRRDNQVKIRGYRIELEDIESKLISYKSINNAAVLLEEKDEEKGIVAYLVTNKLVKETALRGYLVERVPEYMIPEKFILVDEIPLTINGKVDKEKLMKSKGKTIDSGVLYVPPSTAIEIEIVALWQDILEKEKIGLLDDFFALGGHSLKAIRLINDYYKKFEVKLSLKQLFDNTTLESQVALLSLSRKTQYEDIQIVPNQVNYQVSDGQRRIWMLSQFEESSVVYNMYSSINLEGAYKLDRLSQAIKTCIRRHEILRTVYLLDEFGELKQKVIPNDEHDFELQFLDFRKASNSDNGVNEHIKKDMSKSFNLAEGPLLRATLYQIEDEKYVFYYNMHHIIGDSWSLDILEKEVFRYYKAYLKDEKITVSELKIQYKDYAAWQLKQLENDSLKAQKEYWIEQLKGELPKIDLTNTNQRPKIKTSKGKTLTCYLSPQMINTLKDFCDENGGSLFMGVLALWKIALSRYLPSNDLIIGTPVSCRNHKDLEDQIGFYLNTLVLRNTIDSNQSFKTLYNQIKTTTLEAYKNQQYPFDRLVEDLELKQDLSRNAVFDIMFTLQRIENRAVNTGGKKPEIHEIIDNGFSFSKFDIDVSFFELDEDMVLSINYNTDIYEQFFIENLINNFIFLSQGILENVEETIEVLPYISNKEKNILLEGSKDTAVKKQDLSTVIELFKKQVALCEDNVALNFENKTFTYRELDDISNRFTQFIKIHLDVKPGDIVGLKLDRTEWMVIAILSVLKAGAAYVPISTALPQERIDYIKNDSEYSCCISLEDVDFFTNNIADYSTKDPIINSINTDLCYVIYTSGTTGEPKGVAVSQANLVSFISNLNTRFKFEGLTKIAVTTNFTFDISILEIIGGLCTGKELFLFSDTILLDPTNIIKYIEKQQIEILQVTPSRLSQLYGTNMPLPESLKVVLIGGEAMSESVYNRLVNEKFESINVYGPTETTIWSTSLILKGSKGLSIGKPLENEEIYIVNNQNKLLPIGVVGELCIGGDGVAKGYLNKQELTKETFIKNPWVSQQTIYKTGDMARWKEDGTIEFLGRKDKQVKIRGYRIELGDIENALLKNDIINDAVVLVKITEEGEKNMIAYLISEAELNISEIRTHMSSIMPVYMIPSYFIQIDRFPLTSSGKVDRNKLSILEGSEMSSGEKYLAPRDEQEEQIVEILALQLARDSSKISIYDNFFDMGINSLKMMKILSRINEALGVELKVVTLFEYPNVYELTQYFQSVNKEEVILSEPINISDDLDEMLDLI